MNVRTAIDAAGGLPVTVEGLLLVGSDSRLVDHADGDAILLPHPEIEPCLLSRVPAYGGGAYIYHDKAVVTGRVVLQPARFVTIEKLTIIRDDETYSFDSILPVDR